MKKKDFFSVIILRFHVFFFMYKIPVICIFLKAGLRNLFLEKYFFSALGGKISQYLNFNMTVYLGGYYADPLLDCQVVTGLVGHKIWEYMRISSGIPFLPIYIYIYKYCSYH